MDWRKLVSEKRERPTTRTQLLYDLRNSFESDYGRIIFSPALRRMHDKTQVFPLNTDDNIHTRLTHSLEVASVANSLGVNLCNNTDFVNRTGIDRTDLLRSIPVILSCVSLCHDIGNPPFGHFGEETIAEYFDDFFSERKSKRLLKDENEIKDFTHFNGNAQGFRVLTKLQVLQDKYGLNLTHGTLSSFLKYPFCSDELNTSSFSQKIGVFQSEKNVLFNLRKSTGLEKIRNPLAFLAEAADSICYYTMDIEDGFNKHFFTFTEIYDYLFNNGNENVKTKLNEFKDKFKHVYNNPLNEKNSLMVSLRIFLIQILVNHALEKFNSNLDAIEEGKYTKELIKDDDKDGFADVLKNFSHEKVYKNREVEALELTGCSVIKGLLKHFVPSVLFNNIKAKRLYNMVSSSIKTTIEIETNQKDLNEIPNYFILRLIVDYISGMTDSFALKLYQKLQGISI